MIPLLLPPLTGLTVLVTRPLPSAGPLCERMIAQGAQALALPVLDIAAHEHALPDQPYDLLIFISANAVQFGHAVLAAQPQARLAAVGASTAQALIAAGHAVDVAPDSATSSEALLAHPLLQTPPSRILIVRGVGGRELLHDTLTARGATVDTIEVYRRVVSTPAPDVLQVVTQHLSLEAIDVTTLTSVDIAHGLLQVLAPPAREQLLQTAMLAGSARITRAARELGWQGECILATSPEDQSLLDALTRWHTRSRGELLR